MKYEGINEKILKLIKKTVTSLPNRVKEDLKKKEWLKQKNEIAKVQIKLILKNIEIAKKEKRPICQDTGFATFFCTVDKYEKKERIEKAIKWAIKKATEQGFLRPNVVDAISRKNTGNNIGKYSPIIHFEISKKKECEIIYLPKGGGSENCSRLFMLKPYDNWKQYIEQAIKEIGGKGCAPAYLGIVVGSNFETSALYSKKILVDYLLGKGKMNQEEIEFTKYLNKLKIGPMGLGGHPTVLGVRIKKMETHPATLPVSMTYLCWASRVGRIKIRC